MVKPQVFAVLVLSALLILSGCSKSNDENGGAENLLTLTESEYPRIDGSTATIPLGEATAAVLMGKDRADCAVYADFTGTDSAYHRLVNEQVDLLIVYEASRDTQRSIQHAKFQKAAIGSDALVFLVNIKNPVDNLTVEQIRDIYAGKITNWNEVGGDNEPIAAFQRNATAGSQALMESLVMGGTPMMNPQENFLANSMGGLVSAVSSFDSGRYALGYNVYYYVTEMKKDPNIKIISVNGIEPSTETISGGKYPLTNDFYAIIRNDEPDSSPASRVFHWLQESEGQSLIKKEGYVSRQ
jgi:ABC-type phosphate transport system substrate-binding protein